jgi:hypothetical protein
VTSKLFDDVKHVADAGAHEPVDANDVQATELAGARIRTPAEELGAIVSLRAGLFRVPLGDGIPSSVSSPSAKVTVSIPTKRSTGCPHQRLGTE